MFAKSNTSIAAIMGLGASTNVKQIRIDQNDSKWEQPQSAKSKKKWPVNLRRFGSAGSVEDRHMQQLRCALEAAEKRAQQAEDKARSLEREVANLELRNEDLSVELNWLKQQLAENPEVPQLPRPRTGSLSISKAELERQIDAKIKHYEQEIQKLKYDHSRDLQRLQADGATVRQEMAAKILLLEDDLNSTRRVSKKFEDLAKMYAPAGSVEKYNTAGTSSDAGTADASRAQLVLQLSQQISQQQSRISALEEDIVQRDIQISRLNDAVQTTELAMSQSVIGGRKVSAAVQRQLSAQQHHEQDEIDALLAEAANVAQKPLKGGAVSPAKKHSTTDASHLRNVYTFSDTFDPIRVVETPHQSMLNLRPNTADSVRGVRTQRSPKTPEEQKSLAAELGGTDFRATANPQSGRGHSAPQLFKPRRKQRDTHKGPLAGARRDLDDRTEVMSVMETDDRPQPGPASTATRLDAIPDQSDEESEGPARASEVAGFVAKPPALPLSRPGSSQRRVAMLKNTAVVGTVDKQENMSGESDSDEEVKRLFSSMKGGALRGIGAGRTGSASQHRQSGSAKSRDSGFLGDSYASVGLQHFQAGNAEVGVDAAV